MRPMLLLQLRREADPRWRVAVLCTYRLYCTKNHGMNLSVCEVG